MVILSQNQLDFIKFQCIDFERLIMVRIPHGLFMEDNCSLDEIYEAICNRIRERYAEDGEQLTDKEVIEAADNLLGLCNKIVEIEINKK